MLSSKANVTNQEFIWQAKLKQRINPSLHVYNIPNNNTNNQDNKENLDPPIYIELFDFKYPYGYEYLGCYASGVLTVENERMNLSLLTSIFKKQYLALQSIDDVDCSQQIREFSRMTGYNEHNVRLNKEISAESVLSLFQGSLMQGNWLVLDNLQKVD